MFVIEASETGLFLNLKIKDLEVPGAVKVRQFRYERLDTGCTNGVVIADPRIDPVEISFDDFAAMVARVDVWTGEVRFNQSIVTEAQPDIPLIDSSILEVPAGLDYKLEMAGLDVLFSWNRANDSVTLLPNGGYTVTLEGFLYSVITVEKFVTAINEAKAA